MTSKNVTHEFDKNDIKINAISPLYDGFFKISLYDIEHALFKGGTLSSVKREVFERGHAVAVLPYDPIKNKIILVEQFRVGAIETKQSPWLLEIVAGMIDKPESKEQVAIREAEEEAGLSIQKLIPMLDYLSSPGGTTERIYLYLGLVDSTNAGGVFGLDEEQEDIKVHVFDYEQVLDLLQSGELDNAATLISMQWLAMNKQKLELEGKLNFDDETSQ